MADENQITAEDLELDGGEIDGSSLFDLRRAREDAEKRAVIAALARCDGNIVKAADLLGVSRPTLYDLMHRIGITE
jgi:two-component system NtrC family response regulator